MEKLSYRFLRFPEGMTKAVTFSYDDGSMCDIKLCDIFDRFGMKATFNVNSSNVLDPESNTIHLPEMEQLLKRGHEIAIHGYSHKAHAALAPHEAVRETLEDRLGLERALGRIIRGMAYPDSGIRRPHNGNNYETVKAILESLGIAYARALGADNREFTLPTDWHAWMPTCHHKCEEVFELIERFLAIDVDSRYVSDRHPRLLYIWGHSYEFRNNNNWDRIEEICEKLSGKENVWYATNIQIYEYVKAYESLVISADSKMIYNPTLITLWFNTMGKTYSIAPGETLTL
ncbi:MAG: polysaccharide deacetylase family protein [Clostridia bacterium]|nr:polysaccharide deacetylase family protein [Clostridia bacterium]